jgi:hypothetical protein
LIKIASQLILFFFAIFSVKNSYISNTNRAIKYLVSSVLLILQVNIYTCLCYITGNGHIWISVLLVKRLEIQTIYDVNRNKKTKDINRIAKQSGMVTWTRRIILDLIIEILMD